VAKKTRVTSSGRPPFREGRPISKRAAVAAFRGGRAGDVHRALVDGSYCFEPAWLFPWAMKHVGHRDRRVRWAALFVLSRMTAYILAERLEDGSDVLFRLEHLASRDRDQDVRDMAAATLVYLVADAVDGKLRPGR
jgi:hypothetical protein